MKLNIKYILIFVACALLVLLLMGRSFLSGNAEYDVMMPLEEQYSPDQLAVYEDALNTCVQDIKNAHPDATDNVVVLTCLCTAKRVMRGYINADNPSFNVETYDAAFDSCYRVTAEHFS